MLEEREHSSGRTRSHPLRTPESTQSETRSYPQTRRASSQMGPSIDGLSMVSSSPPAPQHPEPYDLLLTGGNNPGMVDNIWQTLFNITDYVIWTQYVDVNGQIIEEYEIVSFSVTLLLLNTNTDALLHAVDVDGDGDDDVQVGLQINLEFLGDSDRGRQLWIEPGIEFTVKEIGSSASDPDWENMKSLHVSLIKAFSLRFGFPPEPRGR